MSAADAPENGANAILVALQTDVDLSTTTTLSQCLRHVVGKQRPALIVKNLLSVERKWSVEELQTAQAILLDAQYLQGKTTAFYLQRIPTVIWFLQFLLESSCGSTGTGLSDAQVNQIVVALLQHTSRSISSTVTSSLQDDAGNESNQDACSDDNSAGDGHDTIDFEKLNGLTVASFAIGALLRGIQPYIASRPILLSPLWKGICDMAAPLSHINPELAEEMVLSLLSYLQEGSSQAISIRKSATPAGSHLPQQHFHAKVLVFLVARMTTLLPLYTRSLPQNFDRLSEVWDSLFELRGLGIAADLLQFGSDTGDDSAVQKLYQPLETKVEQCILKAVCHDSASYGGDGQLFHISAVTSLLRRNTSDGDSFRKASRSLGKVIVLRVLLEQVAGERTLTAEDAELSLSVCDELLFSSVPRCNEYLTGSAPPGEQLSELLSRVLDLATSALLRIAKSSTDSQRQTQIHQLLVRWLASSSRSKNEFVLHPMTRELVVSVSHFYLLRSCSDDNVRSDSPRSVNQVESDQGNTTSSKIPDLAVLLIRLAFDARTNCEHRRNIASVLLRITTACPVHSLGRAIAQCTASEYTRRWKEDCKIERRKRKRGKETSKLDRSQGFRSYAMGDVEILMELLASIGRMGIPALDDEVSRFCQELASENYSALDSKGNFSFSVCRQSSASLSLILSFLSGLVEESSVEGESLHECFERRTGQKVGDFSNALVRWISGRWNRSDGANRSNARLGRSQSIVTVSCLRLMCRVYSSSSASVPFESLGLVQTTVSNCVKFSLEASRGCQNDPEQQRYCLSICFEAIDLLPAMASVVPADCPRSLLEGIAGTFKYLLESTSWPIVSHSMTALVRFASSLPSAHKGILPLCVPPECQRLLQCRLQNTVYRPAEGDIHHDGNRLLELIPSDLETRRGFFTSRATQELAAGSYFLTMPTTNGRSAIVFFPPQDESLEDIKYMLGSDDLSEVNVRRIDQARLVDGGRGCFLRSTPL